MLSSDYLRMTVSKNFIWYRSKLPSDKDLLGLTFSKKFNCLLGVYLDILVFKSLLLRFERCQPLIFENRLDLTFLIDGSEENFVIFITFTSVKT